jgi:hypothetical protein
MDARTDAQDGGDEFGLTSRFNNALIASGESQRLCAEALRAHGLRGASQASVSRWRRGLARPRPSAQAAIDRYCEDHEVAEPGPDDVRTIADLEWQLTQERPLGPRQAALVDAIIARISAPPQALGAHDWRAIHWVAELLGLPVPEIADDAEASR